MPRRRAHCRWACGCRQAREVVIPRRCGERERPGGDAVRRLESWGARIIHERPAGPAGASSRDRPGTRPRRGRRPRRPGAPHRSRHDRDREGDQAQPDARPVSAPVWSGVPADRAAGHVRQAQPVREAAGRGRPMSRDRRRDSRTAWMQVGVAPPGRSRRCGPRGSWRPRDVSPWSQTGRSPPQTHASHAYLPGTHVTGQPVGIRFTSGKQRWQALSRPVKSESLRGARRVCRHRGPAGQPFRADLVPTARADLATVRHGAPIHPSSAP